MFEAVTTSSNYMRAGDLGGCKGVLQLRPLSVTSLVILEVFKKYFESKRETASKCATICWFILQVPATVRAEVDQSWEPGTKRGSLTWMAGTKVLEHLMPRRVHNNRKLGMDAELGLKPSRSSMGCGLPKQCLNHYTKCLPLCHFLRGNRFKSSCDTKH